MSRIQVLPPQIAERIAAGEVIERPASVVKELVENSLDAGATQVAVILEDGGKGLIEILDDGHGMGREDLALAPLRHATSKLRSLEDLERISTLGFRGEALPSVAAVAELSILSRPKGGSSAHELIAGEPGADGRMRIEAVTFGHFLGSDHGTRIRARGLFAQVPARLKFLKAASAEVREVREWLERLALSHPSVSFRLVSEDRTVLNLRGGTEVERVREILGDGGDYPILSNTIDTPGLRIRAHWVQGLSQPQARKLLQIVNHRAVRDRMLQQAMLQPFRQAMLPGQFPSLAIFVEADPGLLDVNVHPTKSEIRFLDSGRVFKLVSKALEELIQKHGAPAFAGGGASASAAPQSSWDLSRPRSAVSPGQGGSGTWKDLFQLRAAERSVLPAENGAPGNADAGLAAAGTAGLPLDGPDSSASPSDLPAPIATTEAAQPGTRRGVPSPIAGVPLAGTLFQTYLLFDLGQELVMIDQHAAHERIRYEKLRRRFLERAAGSSQQMLLPEPVAFPPELRQVFEERLEWLSRLGFEAELFGDGKLLFRAVPLEWGTHSLPVRLKALVDRLAEIEPSEAETLLHDSQLFEKIASEACHSAVRAGDRLDAVIAEEISRELFEDCEHPWNCPHGRPTVVRVPRARFEEWFQRRV